MTTFAPTEICVDLDAQIIVANFNDQYYPAYTFGSLPPSTIPTGWRIAYTTQSIYSHLVAPTGYTLGHYSNNQGNILLLNNLPIYIYMVGNGVFSGTDVTLFGVDGQLIKNPPSNLVIANIQCPQNHLLVPAMISPLISTATYEIDNYLRYKSNCNLKNFKKFYKYVHPGKKLSTSKLKEKYNYWKYDKNCPDLKIWKKYIYS